MVRLYILKTTDTVDEEGRPDRTVGLVEVDWRGALFDVLIEHNINAKTVITALEELITNPEYEVK